MRQAKVNTNTVRISDSRSRQNQEQSPKYSGIPIMLGYASLTRPTMLMQALGAGDQAQAQNDLLAEVLGLGVEVNE
jgi:hypothetical protein